jgi:xanthine dehydrogenase YagT iron-sulfur-binding subunit
MSAVAVLQDKRIGSDDAAVREAMSGNICRCGAYRNIVAAIQDARCKLTGAA